MLHVRRWMWTLAVPAALSVGAVLGKSAILALIAITAHFIVILGVPCFRGYENLWMFILVAVSGIPLNVYLLTLIGSIGLLTEPFLGVGVCRGMLFYSALFGVEQVLMGVVTRLVRRRQRSLNF